jgi:ribosomal protein S18 acetylase RimI-like enzyme
MNDNSIKLNIREFIIEDYEDVVRIWKESGLPYKPNGRDRKSEIEKELKRGCAIFYVAEIEGKLIAVIFGTHDGRKGWINRVAVKPEFKQKGIARKLVEFVEQQFDEMGIEISAALIEDWNSTSMAVFTKLGYIKHDDVFYYSKRKNPDV